MRGYKPHLYGGPHAGRLNDVCETNEIKPQDYANLSRALLISFNCWRFSACNLMIDVLSRPRPPQERKTRTGSASQSFLFDGIDTFQIYFLM